MSPCLDLRARLTGLALVIALTGYAAGQRGALVKPANLAQLTQLSATIIRGNVTAVRVEPHPQFSHLMTVLVTFHVEETLKGNASSQFTFRQFIWDLRDKYDAAGYRKGQELLLLLGPVSSYGLTSPSGMEQGRFLITRDANGNMTAVNGLSNVGLFVGLASQTRQAGVKFSAATSAMIAQPRAGPVPLSEIEEVIHQFTGPAK